MISTVYVPYAGEPIELLQRTLKTLVDAPLPVCVIDNSHGRDLEHGSLSVPVVFPQAPLTLWQTLWMLCRLQSPFIWTQSDAEFDSEVVSRVLAVVTELEQSQKPWGVVFTLYDVFSALNAPALVEKKCLPDLNLPHYHGDPDWYRRMALCGLPTIDMSDPHVKHASPQTNRGGHWRSSHSRDVARQCMDSGRYYREKWGGDIGHETYTVPWNGVT